MSKIFSTKFGWNKRRETLLKTRKFYAAVLLGVPFVFASVVCDKKGGENAVNALATTAQTAPNDTKDGGMYEFTSENLRNGAFHKALNETAKSKKRKVKNP